MKRTVRAVTAIAIALVMLACASASTAGKSGRGAGNTLTAEQLATANSDNLYDAINRLHPDWLTSRGPSSVTDATPTSVDVYMGGTMLGKADVLRGMRLSDVTLIQYWDAGQASARFGMGHPRGVIDITRK